MILPCGWYGDFATLIASDSSALAAELGRGLAQRGDEQFVAWSSSLEVLRTAASRCVDEEPAASTFAAILEYQLPRDDRRPDVIVLENGTVVVIEFKEGNRPSAADVDQVLCYARDLAHYHAACRDRRIVPFLVPIGYRGPVQRHAKGVVVTPPDRLGEEIAGLVHGVPLPRPDPKVWLAGEYAPLPGIAHAARLLFQREPLPRIKRAESAGIPDVVTRLVDIAGEASRHQTRHLVLLTGVPGSGKTLVGLQLVHAPELETLVPANRRGPAPGVFLSGNGPLVEVLQSSLKSKDFVQSLKDFLEYYVGRSEAAPVEHVLVFDEAQRAWDAKKVFTKHRGKLGRDSEPQLLLTIADRIPEWCVVLALVGEGQEIHVGEEGGLALWADALAAHPGWQVHAPARLARELEGHGIAVASEAHLELDTTLRSHVASDLHLWVRSLLEGDLAGASAIVPRLTGFDLYVTRDLDAARRYVRGRYAGVADRRYGLLASSCAENLRGFTLRIKEDGRGVGYGRWYEGTPRGPNYCCSLATSVSEFGCQGLELDFAVLCWGDDITWTGEQWRQRGGKRRAGVKDRERLRANAYRVLLTRGRDGMCIFVPPEPAELMDPVFVALRGAGAEVLLDA